jgi:hypothetical protein
MSRKASRTSSTALFYELSPEELQLQHKRADLARLRRTLLAHEQELAHLRAQLASFEARYIRQVGYLYRQLDEWQQRLDDLLISRMPIPSFEEMLERPVDPSPEPIAEFADSAKRHDSFELRGLFREVAKLIHPDFATNAHDALRRTQLMAEANDAYIRNDAALLRRMRHGHEPFSQPRSKQRIAMELKRVEQQLKWAQADIEAVTAETAALAQSELAVLRATALSEAERGRDHLVELAARVKGNIGMVMHQFEMESSPRPRKPPPIDPESLLTAETFSRRFGTGRR